MNFVQGQQQARKPTFAPMMRLAGAVDATGGMASTGTTSDRTIKFVFSDESIGRDGLIIKTDGWQLGNFLANPVAMWVHNNDQPPIGRVSNLRKTGGALKGSIEFADAATYGFADTIFRLYKGGFLNATSVGFYPIETVASKDPSRPRGEMDVTKAELLEISCVPVPALSTALVVARSRGIITGAELRALTAKAPPAARGFEHVSDRRRYARLLADELLEHQVEAALARMPNGGRGTRLEVLADEWCSVTAKMCLTGRHTAMYDDLEAEQRRLGGHVRRLAGQV